MDHCLGNWPDCKYVRFLTGPVVILLGSEESMVLLMTEGDSSGVVYFGVSAKLSMRLRLKSVPVLGKVKEWVGWGNPGSSLLPCRQLFLLVSFYRISPRQITLCSFSWFNPLQHYWTILLNYTPQWREMMKEFTENQEHGISTMNSLNVITVGFELN